MKSLIKLTVNGLNIDNLMLKIYSNKLKLKNLRRKSHTEIEFEILKKDYLKIEQYLRNYEYKIKELGFNKIRRLVICNIAVILALPVIAYLCYISSLFIWKIEVNGLNKIETSKVYSILSEHKIEKGKAKSKTEIEIEKILLDSGLFAQVSCYFRGTTLMINVSEKLVCDQPDYKPLTANFSGIITDYKIVQGTINFVEGEFVNKGDILVFPYMLDKDGNQVNVEPIAEIYAKIYVSATVSLPENEIVLVRSGKTFTKSKISYKKAKKSFAKDNNPFVFYETKVYNKYISNILPIIRQKVVYYELIEQTKVNDLNTNKQSKEEESVSLALSFVPNSAKILKQLTNSLIIDSILYSTTTICYFGSILN